MPHTTPIRDDNVWTPPGNRIRILYGQLPAEAQRQLLLALARDHTAHLDTAQLLDVLYDLADIITPLYHAPAGTMRAPHDHRPPRREVEGPVYLDLTLGDPDAAQPFTLSVLRNPPRFRSGSPAQPQLLITSFPIDVPGAVSTYHRLGDKLQLLFEQRGYAPGPRRPAGWPA